MDMAVSRKQKAVLKMAFSYVTFTHATENSKLLLYSSNSLFWIFFFIRVLMTILPF